MPADDAASAILPSLPYRVAALAARKPTRFAFTPDHRARALIAAALDLQELPQLTLKGEITPQGRNDYILNAALAATVVQSCAISLAPVTTRITESIARRYLQDFTDPTGDETELPDELDAEPLPEVIDIAAVTIEALLLALPLFPRAPGVALGEATATAPGAKPLDDAALKPFAGLAGLAARLKSPGEGAP